MTVEKPSWQAIGEQKRAKLQELLPPSFRIDPVPSADEQPNATTFIEQFLSPAERDITETTSAKALLSKLADGTLSAVEVTKAFCHRATIAHQLLNCLSEVLFVQAFARAEELDEYLRTHGKPIGPLHGLPISLKDQFRVEGAETSLGYVGWLGKVETKETESWLVKQLKDMGAIIFAKTNVPSSLMAIETNNNIVGYTTNPHNRLLSSGGSSGGEAALLSLRGSIMGFGSDVGASIRVPCSFTGTTGLKPSHGRLPYLNVANSMEGHETVPSVIGPMGHKVSDLRLAVQTVLECSPWLADPKVIQLPWRSEMEDEVRAKKASQKLTFGILRHDGVVKPHPPVERAIEQVVQALENAGYEVIEWIPPAHSEAFQILWNTFAADGGIDIHQALQQSGELPVPQLAVSYGEKLGHLPVGSVSDLWGTNQQKYNYQTRYLEYWNSTAARTRTGQPVDAIISPVAPTASYRPSEGMYFGYTGVYNVLDYSTVVVPVTKADRTLDIPVTDYTPLSDLDGAICKQYDPDLFNGTPVGVQVVCRRLEEEKVLAIADEVEAVLGSSIA
ncbi:amidase [Xylona heveae TC161]|uniref:amidase n=1 Tax=Xylona heveae (strain CBS 132557 / TC161) TaxID=1328760 RepID=A0A164ZKN0_XYLHT|nr:amidase [Xylona heveae TC161]KZF19210.1 amidase [Xylona heveae TC161]